ncbi:hypothetical protein PRIPAC_90680 [Pristionchus pacificus]|uniref:Zf-CHCC domain-containing protein n=1 Tax=Pristionchus pacificus TaxID=54126 RepID=A0A2A6B3L4_PRIPA|nr:hypothetical protein PRIPAC_90680 [Pristionchus pacificus]|eukprot:PDM60458.1 hypothetical protein PRIPAC_53436 [Pristionchus pacificus]
MKNALTVEATLILPFYILHNFEMLALRGLAPRVSIARTLSSKVPAVSSTTSPDKITHTGQGWDDKDWRLQRFDTAPKIVNPNMVNPNVAATLIAEKPPKDCGHERVVHCDGGHAALGHPRVFINLDKPGLHACGYCGNRFYNSHITKSPEDMAINHLNC